MHNFLLLLQVQKPLAYYYPIYVRVSFTPFLGIGEKSLDRAEMFSFKKGPLAGLEIFPIS